ncbi:MAG: hypothetical protein OEZ06_15215 [Myxococcales bacterium]|nr:hypothetical protein [Myxococcales bacterium]
MQGLTKDALAAAMGQAGLEIFSTAGSELRLAERVRRHLMDSGVVVAVGEATELRLTLRGQRSDFPTAPETEVYERVRAVHGATLEERGFREVSAASRTITNPVDEAQTLDVWYELTFAKPVSDADSAIEDVRWALKVPKCIDP